MTTGAAKKFVCYLHNTRAVSALEYAILVGTAGVAIFVVYENYRSDIREAIRVMKWFLSGW